MSKPRIHIGNVSVPLDNFAVARTAILGITRSGKTYAAKGIVEQLMTHGVPVVVFDAIGVWRHLRTPGTGPKARGFPVVVAGGEQPDIPLTADGAVAILRAAMRENVSLVVDLYDPKLSKADWKTIVQQCCRALLYENKNLRHVVIEEAAEYAPQRIIDGVTYAEVEKLVRMGGNRGIGVTMINQRAQELNKAVLDLCDNLLCLRQRGSHAIAAIENWLDRTSPDVAAEVAAKLPNMGQGDVWVWTEASDTPVFTHTSPILSHHPDRRGIGDAVAVSQPPVDTSEFVDKLKADLIAVIAEAQANDPVILRRRIQQLEQQLRKAVPAVSDPEALRQARQAGEASGRAAVVAELSKATQAVQKAAGEAAARELATVLSGIKAGPVRHVVALQPSQTPPAPHRRPVQLVKTEPATPKENSGFVRRNELPEVEIPPRRQRFLDAAAAIQSLGIAPTRKNVCAWIGVHPNGGSVGEELSALAAAGYITVDRGDITVHPDGLAAANEIRLDQVIMTAKSGLTARQSKFFEMIVAAYPGTISRKEIAAAHDLHPNGGSLGQDLGRIVGRGLATNDRGDYRAADFLFPQQKE